MNHEIKEPLIRISKRDGMQAWRAWFIRLSGLLAALIVCGLIIFALTKLNPAKVYVAMAEGAFGTPRRSWVTIRDAMMLLCIGVGLAPPSGCAFGTSALRGRF